MPSQHVLLELTRRYTEPHRHYHDLAHIAWLLLEGRDLGLTADQQLAIWFHDAIYRPGDPENEEESAKLAATLLRAESYPEDSIAVVQHIVRDTKRHVPTISEAELVVDLDLATLSVPWDAYVENTRRLRLEMVGFAEPDIRAGERAFCENFLARQQIYWTPWGAAREARARDNLARMLRGLS